MVCCVAVLPPVRCLSAQLFGIIVVLCSLNTSARATFTIPLAFTHDDAGFGFFPAGSDQRAALEAAAADINAILGTTLGDIVNDPHVTDTVTGNGTNTVSINPSLTYTNPDTGSAETFNPVSDLAADEFRLYVGGRNLSAAAGQGDSTLAQGGRAGVSFGIGASAFEADWVQAVENAETAFNAEYGRGGPIMTTITGTATLGSTPAPYSLSFGAMVGNLWFDTDTNNDGRINKWGKWTEVKETYDYIKGFSKQVKRTLAKLNLKDLPAGHAFQIELKITDITENKSKPMIESLSLVFE